MRAVLVAPSVSGNPLGRAFSLWLVLRELGWEAGVVGPAEGRVWPPLADTEFASQCQPVPLGEWSSHRLATMLSGIDLLVAVKAFPRSLGTVARVAGARGIPWLLDVDDPDLEALRASLSHPQRLGAVRPTTLLKGEHPIQLRRLAALIPRTCLTVSNPALRAFYGTGSLVPHVRDARPMGPLPDGASPVIAFIGTLRAHKGLTMLRDAVAQLHPTLGYRLVVTSQPPPDAASHEDWVGTVPFSAAMELLQAAEVVVIPSLPDSFARLQLPVKLIDAMMFGKTIVAADLPPIEWALGGTGLLFTAGSTDDLTRRLAEAADPELRRRLGRAAHQRALSQFTPGAVAPALAGAVNAARDVPPLEPLRRGRRTRAGRMTR